MIGLADQQRRGFELHLRVASQAEVRVTLGEEFFVDRAVWLMAGGAAVLHRFVGEDEMTRLVAMTGDALLILAGQGNSVGLLENLAAVRIVAIDAVHLPLQHGVMLRQPEIAVLARMAIQAGLRVFAGIENQGRSGFRCLNVEASGAVTGFAAARFRPRRILREKPGMNAVRIVPDEVLVTVGAAFVADELGAFDPGRKAAGIGQGGAGGRGQQARGQQDDGSDRQREPMPEKMFDESQESPLIIR